MRLRNILLSSFVSAPLFFAAGYLSYDKIESYLKRDKDSNWIGYSYEELENESRRLFGISNSPSMDPSWDEMPIYRGEINPFYFDGIEESKDCGKKKKKLIV